MKEILFGLFGGIVTSLGMGGGAILIILLNLFSELDEHFIQGTNLIFFIPTSIVAIFMNMKNKNINYNLAKKIIFPGIVGVFIGTKISFFLSSESLKKYFGIFLLIIAIFEFYSIIKEYILSKKENNKYK